MATTLNTPVSAGKNDKQGAKGEQPKHAHQPPTPNTKSMETQMDTQTASNGTEKVKSPVADSLSAADAAKTYSLDQKRQLLAKVMTHEPELDKVRAELEAAQNKLKALEASRSSDIEALYNAMGGKPFNIAGGRSAKCVKRAYKNEGVDGSVTTNVRWYFEIETPETL